MNSVEIPDPWQIALEDIDVAQPELFARDAHWPYFERLRREDPVHFSDSDLFGPYWSVTRYRDIFAVDTDHKCFSSAYGISIGGVAGGPSSQQKTPRAKKRQQQWDGIEMFIAMDPPRHDLQRASVAAAVSPPNLAKLESTIRKRAGTILDALPVGQTFNWVERVSIELTTQMLATLFDFPFEDRSKLTRWSDVATSPLSAGLVESPEQRRQELMQCLDCFTELWNERVKKPPGNDLVSMLAHGESTRNMAPLEYLGNLLLLIIGGNDTTRNSISGGVLALNQYPAEYDKLRANLSLIPNMVPEIIRWQTPLTHMRRTAMKDISLNGKQIRKGDAVVIWYVSGNRDEDAIAEADRFIIDRPKARQHLSFGFGIHRCMGNRLAEMQLRIVWEEIMKRFRFVEVVGEPKRTWSTLIKGFTDLPVVVHPH